MIRKLSWLLMILVLLAAICGPLLYTGLIYFEYEYKPSILFTLTTGFTLILFVHFVSDYVFLAQLTARPSRGSSKLHKVADNLRAMLVEDQLRIFVTERAPDNIYLVDPFLKKTSLVVGKNVLLKLNRDELRASLLYLYLWRRNKETRLVYFVNTLLLIFCYPLTLSQKILGTNSMVTRILAFYYFPVHFVAKRLRQKSAAFQKSMLARIEKLGLIDELSSGCEKINTLLAHSKRQSPYVLNLAYYVGATDDLQSYILDEKVMV